MAHDAPETVNEAPTDGSTAAPASPGGRASRRRLSVVTLTQNMDDIVGECLESVSWADEIVVVDSHSTDGTREICRRYTRSIHERTYHYAADQKNFGIRQATGDYVLILDADERLTEELAAEIRRVLESPAPADVYFVPRRLMIHGRWLRFGGEYPRARPRLFRRGTALYRNQRVHAPLEYEGSEAALQHDMVHHSYRDLSDLVKRINTFSTRRAQDHAERGRSIQWHHVLWALGSFVHRYVFRGGFRDGMLGLFYHLTMGVYVLVTYAKAWYAGHPDAALPDTPSYSDGA